MVKTGGGYGAGGEELLHFAKKKEKSSVTFHSAYVRVEPAS
jgi:hypothetical protein